MLKKQAKYSLKVKDGYYWVLGLRVIQKLTSFWDCFAVCITYKIESSSFQLWNSRIWDPSLVVSPLALTHPPQPWCESWKTRVTVNQRDVGLVGKCCEPLARTWAVEVARVCHPWEDPSVTAGAGNQVSAETTCPEGLKWGLEQGRGGGSRGWLPSWTANPNTENATTRAFQGNVAAETSECGCFITPFYTHGNGGPAKHIRNAFRTKFNCTYLFLPSLYFLYLTL